MLGMFGSPLFEDDKVQVYISRFTRKYFFRCKKTNTDSGYFYDYNACLTAARTYIPPSYSSPVVIHVDFKNKRRIV